LDPLTAVLGVLLLCVMALLAVRVRALDASGAAMAALFGVVVLAGMGLWAVLVLLLFAGGGSLVSWVGRSRKAGITDADAWKPRGWRNVVGNGAAATLVAAGGFVLPLEVVVFPFLVAVAVAAADTFASELGCLSDRAVLITRPSKRVEPGTNGGVSWLGTFSGVGAAFVVALAGWWVLPIAWVWVPLVVLAGAAGSLLDSLLGAVAEYSTMNPRGSLTKTHVNLVSTLLPAVLAFGVALLVHGA
jgi:uncharacterized protein (TIGR00297 family)